MYIWHFLICRLLGNTVTALPFPTRPGQCCDALQQTFSHVPTVGSQRTAANVFNLVSVRVLVLVLWVVSMVLLCRSWRRWSRWWCRCWCWEWCAVQMASEKRLLQAMCQDR